VQLFESWALNLDERQFVAYVVEPNRRIVAGVRAQIPGAPIIGFPRGAAALIPSYVAGTGVDAVGLDYMMPVASADSMLPAGLPVQGNMDPLRLVAGGAQMEARIEEIIAGFSGRPHIFNLGHGIVPETPIGHVERLVDIVKQGR
jgi:uroporphyrinogen decarboxylase